MLETACRDACISILFFTKEPIPNNPVIRPNINEILVNPNNI